MRLLYTGVCTLLIGLTAQSQWSQMCGLSAMTMRGSSLRSSQCRSVDAIAAWRAAMCSFPRRRSLIRKRLQMTSCACLCRSNSMVLCGMRLTPPAFVPECLFGISWQSVRLFGRMARTIQTPRKVSRLSQDMVSSHIKSARIKHQLHLDFDDVWALIACRRYRFIRRGRPPPT